MNFLKALFGGGGSSQPPGLFVYVKPKACDEIIKVRIDIRNEVSVDDSGDGYFVRKVASGTRCPFQAELWIYFNKNRDVVDRQIENGEFVTEADYIARYGEEAAT